MSTSDSRRSYDGAMRDAEDFRAMFPPICFHTWTIAGSLRRKMQTVSDVDHVVIPHFGDKPNGGLFADKVNLLLYRMDELLKAGEIAQHLYGAGGPRWGEKLRGSEWRGMTHEVHCVSADSYGGALAIFTGPHEFSKSLVTSLLRNGRRNHEGKVWSCNPCPNAAAARCEKSCQKCQGTQLVPVEVISVPTEQEYFRLCGVTYVEPEARR